jgi:hypothetical protein
MKHTVFFFFIIMNAALLGFAESDRPEWVTNPPVDDEKIFGIGVAVESNASRGWRMAENRAHISISYQVTAIVENMKAYYEDVETGMSFYEEVNRRYTSVILHGMRVEMREQGENGTYYVLVSYPKPALRDEGVAAIQTAAENTQIDVAAMLQAMDAAFAAKYSPQPVGDRRE